jgi:hypothetical protein
VIDIWDSDPGNDDYLGTWRKTLDVSNAWGFADQDGIWNSGAFAPVNNLLASPKADANIASIPEATTWWGWRKPSNPASSNFSTDRISHSEFAEAFQDVDSYPEWYDVLDDIDSIFYEGFIRSIAQDGNCFGLCLEAANARTGASLFALP